MRTTRALLPIAAAALIAAGCVARVSTGVGGSEANGWSSQPSISATGRFVAFTSLAGNLVAGDINNDTDIFVRDVVAGTTTRVSVSTSGVEADASSWDPVISGNGRRVVFWSNATTLVDGESDSITGVFLHDMTTHTTSRLSVAADGTMADGPSYLPAISADGNTVVFESDATNLVDGDTNERRDIFRRDLITGTTERLSLSTDGTEANNGSTKADVSGDGQVVAFVSYATNLVADDTNNRNDVFVRDRTAGTTSRVSVSSSGDQLTDVLGANDPTISGDGQLVAFASRDAGLVADDTNNVDDIFVHDRTGPTTTRVSNASDGSQSDRWSGRPAMSTDGRYVVFESFATLGIAVSNDVRDAFIVDRATGTLSLLSKPPTAPGGNGESHSPAVSGSGTWAVFASSARNLTLNDLNRASDIFMWRDTD